jgi:hypothetical protein
MTTMVRELLPAPPRELPQARQLASTLTSVPRSRLAEWTGLGLLTVLVLATLPQAAVPAWARTLLTWALLAGGAWLVVAQLRGRCLLQLPPGTLWAAALVGLGVLQCLPLGAGLGPRNDATTLLAPLLDPARHGTWSLSAARSLERALEGAAVLIAFVVAATCCRRPAIARCLVWVLLAFAAVLACHGILVRFGVLPRLHADQPTGIAASVVFNRNHYAGFLERATVCGVISRTLARNGS